MRACEHCREHLFDYVYGLAEESEAVELAAHLVQCPTCQAELETARTQQQLVAQAARAISVVPEFVLPSDITAAPPTASPGTAVPGLSCAPRPIWRRAWVAVAFVSAAAVLLVVSLLTVQHHQAINELQNDLTAKRREYQRLDQQFAALPAKHGELQKAALAGARVETIPHLHVLGPAHLEPGAKANLHLTHRNVEGELARGRVVVKLVDEATKKLVQETPVDVDGQARVEIESVAAMPNNKLTVIVEAGRASVTDTIQIATPTYATRIDTSKHAYQVNEVLFFRALVLDRWSLKPPAAPVMLEVALVNPKNETVATFKQATEAGGILAGELPIAANFLAGNYTLKVRPIDGGRVQPAAQRLEIVRDVPTPDIELNQQRYLPGDVLSGGVFVPGGQPIPKSAKATFGGQPVPVTIDPQPTFAAPAMRGIPALPGAGGAGGGKSNKADAKQPAFAPNPVERRFGFSLPLPKQLPEGARQLPLKLELENGADKKAYNALVAIEPTDYAIDLFPEGGDLIAGVPNHVFFRVRSRTGDAITGAGRVILLSSKNEIVDAPYQLGLGSFAFTPDLKETYTIRITSPVKTSEVAQPFAKLGVRTAGVVLHVPHAVGKQGEPIEVTLRNQGPPRKLLLVAQCRGQIVDQRWIDVTAGSKACQLETTSEARGMIRVTAYEADGDTLQPVAERLVYRAANASLNLGVTFNAQQFSPGQTIKGNLSARDEAGKDTATWILASVVDERFQARPRSLSAHFMLLNEMHADAAGDGAIDNAQVILHDTPEAVQVLERFLGTHGWRRFVGAQALAAQSGIFSRENLPLATLQKQHEDRLAAAVTPLRTAAFAELGKLELERLDSAKAVEVAASELARVEGRIPPWRLAFGLGFACLLAGSLIQLGVGLYRIIRQHQAATPAFGGAFACLSVCLVMWFVGRAIAPIEPSNLANLPTVGIAWEQRLKLQDRLAHPPVRRERTESPPVGALAMLAPRQDEQAAEKKAQAKTDRPALQDSALAMRFTAQPGGFGGNTARRNASPAMLARLNELEQQGQGQPAPPIAPKTKKSAGPVAKAAEREFAPKHAPDLSADTLLWSPTLWLADGAGEVRFDIASGQATYRVLLLGHTPTGRFGIFETRLDVPAMGR